MSMEDNVESKKGDHDESEGSVTVRTQPEEASSWRRESKAFLRNMPQEIYRVLL